MSTPATPKWRRALQGLVVLGIAAATLHFALDDVATGDLLRVFSRSQPEYLLAALPLLAASYAMRGLRWHYLFPREVRAHGLRHATGILLVGFLLNNFLPARAGELARVVLMARHNKVKASGTLATLFAERVFDGFVLGMIGLLALPAMVGSGLLWVQRLSAVFGVLFVALLAAAFFHRSAIAWVERISARFPGHLSRAASNTLSSALGYLGTLSSPPALMRAFGCTLLVWTFEAAVYALVARAFGVELGVARVGGFLSVVNFASLAPTPGGMGAVEFAGTAALSAAGIAREAAFVIVTAQHALQYAFCLLAGGFFAGRLGFTLDSKVVAPFRHLVDLEQLLSEPPAGAAGVAEKLRALKAGTGPKVSVVVPAYNEERRILPTLLSIIAYFQELAQSYEIIVVDDGSKDATAEVVQQLSLRVSEVRLICLPSNCGKGAAVRAGMRSARGEFLLFSDADGATPIAELTRLEAAILDGADLAIGSRALASQETHVERTLKRAIVGRSFAFLVNSWVVPGVADTQCGFKLFRRSAAQRIFELQQLDGFAFDVEVLKLASVLDYRLCEVPVNWADQAGSKVSIISDSFKMLWDIVRIPYLSSVARATGSLAQLPERERAQP